jgi:hypothetical protein
MYVCGFVWSVKYSREVEPLITSVVHPPLCPLLCGKLHKKSFGWLYDWLILDVGSTCSKSACGFLRADAGTTNNLQFVGYTRLSALENQSTSLVLAAGLSCHRKLPKMTAFLLGYWAVQSRRGWPSFRGAISLKGVILLAASEPEISSVTKLTQCIRAYIVGC